MKTTRRDILTKMIVASGLLTLPRLGAKAAKAAGAPDLAGPLLDATPACHADGPITLSTSEGPYFSPASPQRSDIREGKNNGVALLVGGYVLNRDCTPVSQAQIEIWQADDRGKYDNDGYYLRGHQITGDDGKWAFLTIIPAAYPGRCQHIHFKVQRPGGAVLTSQVFFPNDPLHGRDYQFDGRLLLKMDETGPQKTGLFNFVLA
ncbi:hypothetical protein [Thalassospira marina]|uniref:Intradiol ring-cleavage dioxygenases domain-containing protein n=1 Tax=Thalassospira marina TaxID=2048283 RepID=A0ABN5FFG9_9PROT|nr:hypothetical protein [Thalassospira marina]AUG53861.1 hypothetical protein CSC3H3_14935 [Thalassospira marina]